MKAIMVMFDSLNRHMLQAYGCDWVKAPNFKRLSEKSVTFTNSFVGSMPCMPARREIHTGRLNFLHRSWGPLEPFDDSMPQILKNNDVYTHIVTDHYHYFEDGGCTYHQRYNTWRASRGQEGDPWMGVVQNDDIPENLNQYKGKWKSQDWVNRKYMQKIADQPQAKTFRMGMEFLETNYKADNWFLTIETFDPHEPYFSDKKYQDLYPDDYDGPLFDWPPYGPSDEHTPEQIEHIKKLNAALISMCDEYMGKVLDFMDDHDMWDDTMLIVNTDHGFLLGEHDCWAKCWCPYYNEIAHTPLFIWDPRAKVKNQQRHSLVQTIDLAPTVLEYFGQAIPKDMQGKVLKDVIVSDEPVRDALLFGMFGAHVNCTDGKYVYMRAPANKDNQPLYDYTLMPTHMREMFQPDELQNIQLAEPFTFTKGCRTMKIKSRAMGARKHTFDTMLFDIEDDPKQQSPIDDKEVEAMMIKHMIKLMEENDCPPEQFERLGLK